MRKSVGNGIFSAFDPLQIIIKTKKYNIVLSFCARTQYGAALCLIPQPHNAKEAAIPDVTQSDFLTLIDTLMTKEADRKTLSYINVMNDINMHEWIKVETSGTVLRHELYQHVTRETLFLEAVNSISPSHVSARANVFLDFEKERAVIVTNAHRNNFDLFPIDDPLKSRFYRMHDMQPWKTPEKTTQPV